MFGKRLAKLRNDISLTQEELADRLSMSRSTYAQYEVDRREPDFKTLTRLADFFNVSVDYLLGRDEYIMAANRSDNPMNDLPPEAQKEIDDFTKYVRHKYKVQK